MRFIITLISYLVVCSVFAANTTTQTYRKQTTVTKDPLQTLVDEAEALEKKQDYGLIIEKLKTHSDKLSRRGLLLLARAYRAKKMDADEGKILTLAINRDPQDFVILTQLGQVHARMGRNLEASKYFRQALQIKRDHKDAFEGLYNLAVERNNRYEIRSLLEEQLDVLGPDAQLLGRLCESYSRDVFIEKAIQTCQAAIEKDPKKAENHVYLGLSYQDDKNKVQAKKVLMQAAKQFPNSAFAQCSAAQFARNEEDLITAIALFRKGVAADSKNLNCHLGIADASFSAQNYDDALKALNDACSLDRKKVLPLIKKAAGQMRQEKKLDWQEKFNSLATRCG